MKSTPCLAVGVALTLTFAAGGSRAGETVGALASVRGMGPNHLVGLGIVVGLGGTGDTAPATSEALRRISVSCGLGVAAADLRNANSALVMVTAELPPFAAPGTRFDVTVSAFADATSLAGGTLLSTPLWAGDPGNVFARAQGPVTLPSGERSAATSGVIRIGAIVQRGLPPALTAEFESALSEGRVTLDLREASSRTATAIANALEDAFSGKSMVKRARARTPGQVAIELGTAGLEDPVAMLAAILDVRIASDRPPRVVINEKLGTVYAQGDIVLGPAAVSTGAVMVTVGEASARTTLVDFVASLEKTKVSPADLIDVLHALVRAGSLRAEIVLE